ncbi:hypothetical protein [Streptomyces flavidovirens]|uniref:beta-xylosidase family glycoside hydrolase n=1 Tax=Streptomyces flavidovirens TaxID=67298 RepID=UPI003699875E
MGRRRPRRPPQRRHHRKPGHLTLHARPATEPPVFIGRRQQHPSCTIRAAVDASRGSGGLALRMDDRHLYALVIEDQQVHAEVRIGPSRS